MVPRPVPCSEDRGSTSGKECRPSAGRKKGGGGLRGVTPRCLAGAAGKGGLCALYPQCRRVCRREGADAGAGADNCCLRTFLLERPGSEKNVWK